MVTLTRNEKKAILILFKDFRKYYNSNSLSNELNLSRVGCMKILKKLEKEELLSKENIGKSIVYKPSLRNEYVLDLLSFLLSDEANNFKRWKDEFKELYKKERVVILYGSTITNYPKAKDIDIIVIRKKGESAEIHKTIQERQKLLPKKIHLIDLTPQEFVDNLKQKHKAMTDIVKNSIILYGQEKYVGLIKNVSSI